MILFVLLSGISGSGRNAGPTPPLFPNAGEGMITHHPDLDQLDLGLRHDQVFLCVEEEGEDEEEEDFKNGHAPHRIGYSAESRFKV